MGVWDVDADDGAPMSGDCCCDADSGGGWDADMAADVAAREPQELIGLDVTGVLDSAALLRDRCRALLASRWNGCGRTTRDEGSSWLGKKPL